MFNANDFDLIIQFPDRKKIKMFFQMEMDFRNKNLSFSIAFCILTIPPYFIFYFKIRRKQTKSILVCNTFSAVVTIFLMSPKPTKK